MNENASPRVPYDISPDGQRVVVEVSDAEGRNRLWLAPLDRRPPPRQIPNVEGDGPLFLSNEEVVFRGKEGDYGFAYRVRTDGTELQKLSDHSVISTTGLSRDGKWLVVYARPSEEQSGGTLALPLGGGPRFRSLAGLCGQRGPPLGGSCSCRRVVLSVQPEPPMSSSCHPARRSQRFRRGGCSTPKRLPACPGYRSLTPRMSPPAQRRGCLPLSRVTVQLNIYRIPIP